ncbi:hypothetical protein ACSNOH_28965 [Streptomyces sp. URMC 127]|uniref:hypothetical protein n=1 Tax=Streptomyces sp. URMC 127 TaxID=3423402 RepID=UPI003F1ABA63
MSADLTPLIAATTQWLTRAYPSPGGAVSAALAQAQARQAVTVAAWLRYPTSLDAALVMMSGPGGAARLDWQVGADCSAGRPAGDEPEDAWRTWVDEVVASWAACLLTDPSLAGAAVAAVSGSEHADGLTVDFRRITGPDELDRGAAALLRHPDLLAPISGLHASELADRLRPGHAPAA